MKKLIYWLFVAGTVAFASCNKTNEIELTEPEIDDPETYYERLELVSMSETLVMENNGRKGAAYIKSSGSEIEVLVDTDDPKWELNAPSADWFEVKKSKAGFEISVSENTGAAHTAKITVTAGKGHRQLSAEIELNQFAAGGNDISVDQPLVYLTTGGKHPIVVNITTDNDGWQYESEPSEWLLVEKGARTLTFSATPNPLTTVRSAKVNVYAKDPEQGITIFIRQDVKPTISSSRMAYCYVDNGGSGNFTVTTNQEEWNYSVSDNVDDWFTITRDANKLSFTVPEYTGAEDRQAVVTLTAGPIDDTVESKVYITQRGSDPAKMILIIKPGSNSTAVLPLAGELAATVDWGDGTVEFVDNKLPEHKYASGDTYYVSIDGLVTQLSSIDVATSQRGYIIGVLRWGKTGLLSMTNAFNNCRYLTTLPDDTEGSFSEVTSFQSAFEYNTALKVIPDGLFRYATKATNFKNLFRDSNNLSLVIPDGLLDNCVSATTFANAFYYVRNASAMKADMFKNCPNLEDVSGCFASNTYITSIPETIFANNPKITDFSRIFFGCTGLTSIPEKLFEKNTKAKNFSSAFYGCTKITSIPEDLFVNCPEAKYFEYLFNGCSGLNSTLPAGLFRNNKDALTFYYAFYGTKLTSLPQGLFDSQTEVRNFGRAFYNVTTLKTIPAGLFANVNPQKDFTDPSTGEPYSMNTSYDWTFYGCTGLTAIPDYCFGEGAYSLESTFYNCTAVTSLSATAFTKATKAKYFTATMAGCSKIPAIPAGLFDTNTEVTSFSAVFYNFKAITSIPAGLFDNNEKVTSFGNTFYGCTGLTGVPADLFDKNTKVFNFSGTFYGCSNLTGESPYYDNNGTKIHIYERNDHPDLFETVTSLTTCFRNCTKLTDYAAIPADWK